MKKKIFVAACMVAAGLGCRKDVNLRSPNDPTVSQVVQNDSSHVSMSPPSQEVQYRIDWWGNSPSDSFGGNLQIYSSYQPQSWQVTKCSIFFRGSNGYETMVADTASFVLIATDSTSQGWNLKLASTKSLSYYGITPQTVRSVDIQVQFRIRGTLFPKPQ